MQTSAIFENLNPVILEALKKHESAENSEYLFAFVTGAVACSDSQPRPVLVKNSSRTQNWMSGTLDELGEVIATCIWEKIQFSNIASEGALAIALQGLFHALLRSCDASGAPLGFTVLGYAKIFD